MKKIKLALVGCSGRMGQQIIKEIENFKNIDLVAAELELVSIEEREYQMQKVLEPIKNN